MRRLLGLAFLLSVLGCVHGRVGGAATAYFSETQACTAGTCARAAAPVSTNEGMGLVNVVGYRMSVCAATSQTLSGAGTMQAYWCDATSTLCMRNPQLDQPVTASGVQCQVFPDFQVAEVTGLGDSVVFAASGVTVNAGANVTVRIYPFLMR